METRGLNSGRGKGSGTADLDQWAGVAWWGVGAPDPGLEPELGETGQESERSCKPSSSSVTCLNFLDRVIFLFCSSLPLFLKISLELLLLPFNGRDDGEEEEEEDEDEDEESEVQIESIPKSRESNCFTNCEQIKRGGLSFQLWPGGGGHRSCVCRWSSIEENKGSTMKFWLTI